MRPYNIYITILNFSQQDQHQRGCWYLSA